MTMGEVMASGGPLRIAVRDQNGALLVTPVGRLDQLSYGQLRDTLLKCVAEEPVGVIVNLAELTTDSVVALAVFSAVWMRAAEWPGLPVLLAASRDPLRSLLVTSAVPRFVPTYSTVAKALASLPDQPARRRVRLLLHAGPDSASRAREFVRVTCQDWGTGPVVDAVLVASELVENAVQYAGSASWLRLELYEDRLTVAVSDDSPEEPPRKARRPRPVLPRGLTIVGTVALAWGTSPSLDGGKVVWVTLRAIHGRQSN